MKQPSYIAILGAILSFLSPVTTRCYYPNGNVSDGLACDPHAAVSVCCQREWSCLSNGVCRLLNNTEHFYAFERGSCTDSSWSSPKCPRFCQQRKISPRPWISDLADLSDSLGLHRGSCCRVLGSYDLVLHRRVSLLEQKPQPMLLQEHYPTDPRNWRSKNYHWISEVHYINRSC